MIVGWYSSIMKIDNTATVSNGNNKISIAPFKNFRGFHPEGLENFNKFKSR